MRGLSPISGVTTIIDRRPLKIYSTTKSVFLDITNVIVLISSNFEGSVENKTSFKWATSASLSQLFSQNRFYLLIEIWSKGRNCEPTHM